MTQKTFIFDACTFIDLSINTVDCLDFILNNLKDSIIYVSDVNFSEIKDTYVKKIISDSDICEICPIDDAKLTEFWKGLTESRLNLGKKDAAVLFLATSINADYVVSSDWNVIDKTSIYQRNNGIKSKLKALSTINFLELMVRFNVITPNSHIKRGLLLFEGKEFQNTCQHLSKKCNGCSDREIVRTINDEMDNIKTRFSKYRQSVVTSISS
ncbi:hypothetical protein [Methanospirillum lacunae]|uniref:PIN domain-containing protein n=1 Tax=Methanospirillum lacunae TaxID=668570 RepID=A0A2V2N6W9_9EURY|nr:hypothetical protein [Methanospirillum lacunae]PWR71977.1 hypothetical protein DK846_08255 [Methanospirillum lacunae]